MLVGRGSIIITPLVVVIEQSLPPPANEHTSWVLPAEGMLGKRRVSEGANIITLTLNTLQLISPEISRKSRQVENGSTLSSGVTHMDSCLNTFKVNGNVLRSGNGIVW